MIDWQAFHFLRPEWLLIFLPFAGILYLLFRKDQEQLQWKEIIAPHLLKHLGVEHSDYRSINPVSLSAFLIVLIIIILAGPSWSRQTTPLSQDQSSLVILLDASQSMNQTDIQPTRLERSKHKIQDLLEMRQGSRTALIVFAGSAHTVLPLSDDKDILTNYLQAIKTNIIPVSGKFPERSLTKVTTLSDRPDSPMTLLWIGDGFSSQTRASFKDYFSLHSHQLLILGVGKTRDRLRKSEQLIPLEKEVLQAIASENGGHYIQATHDTSDIRQINQYIERHFVNIDDDFSPWLDQGYYLIFPLMILFLLWFRKGWILHWVFFLAIQWSVLTPTPTLAAESLAEEPVNETVDVSGQNHYMQAFLRWWLTPNQQGHWYYHRSNYALAARNFEDPLWKGVAFYQAEQFKAAAEYFSRIDSSQGLFYLANAQAHAQDYLKAIATYDRLLKREPEHKKAQTNRKIVRELADAINRMSESQHQDKGEDGGSKELGKDDPQRAEGAEVQTLDTVEKKQYNADEILQDNALHEMWMRNVQPDPSRFLGSKFMMQINQQSAEQPVQSLPEGEQE